MIFEGALQNYSEPPHESINLTGNNLNGSYFLINGKSFKKKTYMFFVRCSLIFISC